MSTALKPPVAERQPFQPLPAPRTVTGPRTRAVMRRAALTLGLVWVVAGGLVIADVSDRLTAFALGIFLPGGGFLYTGHPVLFVLSLAAFAVALLIFFVMSPYWVPPLVLFGLAGLAALIADGHTVAAARIAVPAVVLCLLLALPLYRALSLRAFRREVAKRNAFLAERTWSVPVVRDNALPEVTSMTDDDLASMRRGLDLLLQPLDQWQGFLTIDQYREAAWRYQLNFMAWYLAVSRLTRTPAFTGYVAEAQKNAVDKTLDLRVWKYWRYEHLLGSLKWDPDPIPNDNIMLSGYFAAQVGSYEAATADLSYSQPGALTFDDGKHAYVYNYAGVCEAVRRNFQRGPFCMFPCEPNWVYPQCNAVGMTGLLLHDRIHSTDYAGSVWEDFEDALLQDLSRPDDRVVTIKSNRYGVSIPSMEVGVMSDAGSGLWYSPLVPELAARRWEVARDNHLRLTSDGGLQLCDIGRLDRIDIGSYNLNSLAFAYGTVMAAAHEMGDEEIYHAAKQSLEQEFTPDTVNGARHLDGVSPMAQGIATMGRMLRKHAWHDLVRDGVPDVWLNGPRLEEAPYPDVLVARAVSDGQDLDLELVPGDGGGRVDLRLGGLSPARSYAVTGAVESRITGTATGHMIVSVDLHARQRVRVVPEV
jgi:Linalool dehydratase/isomerase